jgi:hypothetical protein
MQEAAPNGPLVKRVLVKVAVQPKCTPGSTVAVCERMQRFISDVLLPRIAHRENEPQVALNIGAARGRHMRPDADARNVHSVAKASVRLKHPNERNQRRNCSGAVKKCTMRRNVRIGRLLDALYVVALANEAFDVSAHGRTLRESRLKPEGWRPQGSIAKRRKRGARSAFALVMFPLPFNYFPKSIDTARFFEDSIHCIAKVMGTHRILERHWF